MSGATAISSNNALSFTSFGADGRDGPMLGAQVRPAALLKGERYRLLDFRQAYYDCTQHDMKGYDFDGRVVSGPLSTQPLMSAEKMSFMVPLKMRKPSAPYRLGRVVVDAFTNLLFGENRFPLIRVDGDTQSEDFYETVSRVGRFPMTMIRARSIGGSMGSAGVSWSFHHGKPRFEVHNPKNIFIHSWRDRTQLLPRHVTEIYPFYRVEWTGKEFENVYYWFRRDWTPDADILFKEVRHEKGLDPVWIVDKDRSVQHEDGINHFNWIQNIPSDEIDGFPDYHGTYDAQDQLDILCSVVAKGAVLNLDPTVVLRMDPDLVDRTGIGKGSDKAIVPGVDGDAHYMELAGTSIEAGIKLIEMKRRAILETVQCIIPDSNEVAAQGISSVAIKAMFAPMTAKADILREQYGSAIERILTDIGSVARAKMGKTIRVTDSATGEDTDAEVVLDLPPKVTVTPEKDPLTGETKHDEEGKVVEKITRTERRPGDGGDVNLRWPPYFSPTFDDQVKVVNAMNMATGGKQVISQETATELTAAALGVNPTDEMQKMQGEKQSQAKSMEGMTPGFGGEVDHKDEPPHPALARAQKAKQPPFGKPNMPGADTKVPPLPV